MTTGLALPLRHKPAALDPDAWRRSPRTEMSGSPLHSQALLGRGGHSRSPSPRPEESPMARENAYGTTGVSHSAALRSARQHSVSPRNMPEPSMQRSEASATPTPLTASMSPRHSKATLDASTSLRSDLATATPGRHSSSLSPRHSLQHRSPTSPEGSAATSEQYRGYPTASGQSTPMHSQVLVDLRSPRRSPVAMDVELSPAPGTVRHRLTIPELPNRGDESPGQRLTMCMSEEFRPLQAGGEARAPYDRELDKYRPLSPQASQGPEDELERYRPLSPMSKLREVENSDRFQPMVSPESDKKLRFSDKRSASSKELAKEVDEETARQEEITQRLTMQLRNRSRSSSRASSPMASPQATRRVLASPLPTQNYLPGMVDHHKPLIQQQQLQEQMRQLQLQQQQLQQQMQGPTRSKRADSMASLASLASQPSVSHMPTQQPLPTQMPTRQAEGGHMRHPRSLENSPMTRVSFFPEQAAASLSSVESTPVVRRSQKSSLQTAPTIPLPSHEGLSLAPYGEAQVAQVAQLATEAVKPQGQLTQLTQLGPQVVVEVDDEQVTPHVQQAQQVAAQQVVQQLAMQAAPQQIAAQQIAAQQIAALQVAPQQVAQQAAPHGVAAHQFALEQVVPQHVHVPPQQVAQQFAPHAVAPQHLSPQPFAQQGALQVAPPIVPEVVQHAAVQPVAAHQFTHEVAQVAHAYPVDAYPAHHVAYTAPQELEMRPAVQELHMFQEVIPPPPHRYHEHEVARPPPPPPPTPPATFQSLSSVQTAHSAPRHRAASEPRLQRNAGTMTEGSTTSSTSKERIRTLESEVHAQSKWIRSLEGDLKTAEGRAERFQATGLAAQKELETALSQLQVSSEEAKNGRIAHLEGKLQALESREPKKMKHSSSEGSVRSSRIADLERQVEKLTSQLKLKDQKSLTSLQSSEVSEANRVRTTQWQERCELLRRSLERESASEDLRATRERLRDAEGKVQSLTAELRGLRQAQGGQAEAKLKQQLTELEVELMLRKERCSMAEAQLLEVSAELGDAKAARTRTMEQYKGLDSELDGARRRIAHCEREVARAKGERLEAEQKCQALQKECRGLKKELHDTKEALRVDLPMRTATARADALIEAAHLALTDTSSTTSEVDLVPHRKVRAADFTAGALEESRRELKKSQKEASSLRRELTVAVASAISAKAMDPPSRRRQGVRLRIEREAAERLALGLGPVDA